jgi:hypothetical protein
MINAPDEMVVDLQKMAFGASIALTDHASGRALRCLNVRRTEVAEIGRKIAADLGLDAPSAEPAPDPQPAPVVKLDDPRDARIAELERERTASFGKWCASSTSIVRADRGDWT